MKKFVASFAGWYVAAGEPGTKGIFDAVKAIPVETKRAISIAEEVPNDPA